jgi:hypothetical protein
LIDSQNKEKHLNSAFAESCRLGIKNQLRKKLEFSNELPKAASDGTQQALIELGTKARNAY